MKSFARTTLLASALMLALSACNAQQKPVDVSATGAAAGSSKTEIAGLSNEKEQVSYTIGMAMGKQLADIKDEVNVETVIKALKTEMSGGKALISDEQAQQIMQDFGQKMQAKQIAKMMEAAKANEAKGEKFLAENAKKAGVVTTASGLQYQVLTEGKGAKPGAEDGVKVHYKGTLIDGTEFDSSYKRGEPAVLPLNGVIPGWSEGLQLMPVGSKYKFWIPSKLAYGEQAPPVIGPNQMLEFEVELLEVVKKKPGSN